MRAAKILFFTAFALLSTGGWAQLYDQEGHQVDENGKRINRFSTRGDSVTTTNIPTGLFVWTVEKDFGDIRPAEIDTVPHQFQNHNFTSGMTGQYNHLGNLGSPRLNRIFMNREAISDFMFADPFDFFITKPQDLHYTNTKSPITNITYDKCGNRTNGEDHIKALFAINAGKKVGLGFKIDYLYGRGYYNSQSTAFFNGTIYGSYRGDHYQMHASYSANHLKMAENGGIEQDLYVTNPESLPNKYGAADIPTRIDKTWNRVYLNTLYLTHRYNIGFYRTRDKQGRTQKRTVVDSAMVRGIIGDSLKLFAHVRDSLIDVVGKREADWVTDFQPVTSINHTLRIDQNQRRFVQNRVPEDYFLQTFYNTDSINDRTHYLHIGNTVALQLHEGLNKWMQAGVTLFARHDFSRYEIPVNPMATEKYTENELTLGGRLSRTQGKHLRYEIVGSTTTSGDKWGEFHVGGHINLNLPLRHDTIALQIRGHIVNEQPSFYMRHFHSAHAWWDNDLSKQWSTRVEGLLSYSRTRTSLRVGVENIKNYAYFAALSARSSADSTLFENGVEVRQKNGNVQVFSAVLNQNFKWGIFNWENELAFQSTTDKDVLPLPSISVYSNVYLLFRIAKVLRVQFGADVRWFTKYYAPAYSPLALQFATQSGADRVKIGGYPIVNAYLNFHLKHTRFYVDVSHINKSSNGGRYFLTPHYPINPLVVHLGLSWNFFN